MSIDSASELPMERTDSTEAWSRCWPQTTSEFEALVENMLDRLSWYAFRQLGNIDDAEDVVQEVLVRVYADRKKRCNIQRVVPYIYRMVTNACNDRKRHHNIMDTQIDPNRLENIPDESGDHLKKQIEQAHWIEQLLSHLPEKQAEVIRLRVIDDLPLSDISVICGCSLSSTKSRLCYGLQKLRNILPDPKEGNL